MLKQGLDAIAAAEPNQRSGLNWPIADRLLMASFDPLRPLGPDGIMARNKGPLGQKD